jgi:hypothetical protein
VSLEIQQVLIQILWIFILAVYAFIVIYSTKKTYEWMTRKGIKEKEAIYYNRKLIHIFAGGVIALLVPVVFTSPWYPLFCGLGLAVFTFFSHKGGEKLYWFQTKKDLNDVNFCLMWGLSIFILWWITGNPWIAIIPSVFMALGDGITGIVRNIAFKERSKHPIGNIYMAFLCIPFGYYLGGFGGMALAGVIAAIVASVVERYEIGLLDDNVLITLSSSIILYTGFILKPMIMI